MATFDPHRDWKTVISFLPADYEALAQEHKQLRTQFGNAKITTADVLLRFIFVHTGADLGLRQTVALIAAADGPSLSPMRLHMKMRQAAPYLQALVTRMTEGREDGTPERWGGYEMVGVDATTVSSPGSDGINARVHAVLRLSDLALPFVQITDSSGGETFKRFGWSAGQLVIADRGYSNTPGVAWVVDQGADVLVRVNRGAMPIHDSDGKVIDVLAWLRSLTGHRAIQKRVHLESRESRATRAIEGRLVGFRLPEKEAADARARVVSEHGSATTAEQLEAAGYVALFTTAPAERLSAARCVEAYRLRWQIELQFKRWKSLCNFDRLPNYRDDTVRAWLTAKVLLGLVLDRIGSVGTELSPPVRPAVPERRPRVRSSRAATGTPAVEDHQHHLARAHRSHLADGAA